ncbi:MAG: DJ-1/PfpI family protein [Bacillota bacterium]
MKEKGLIVLSHDNEDVEALATRALLVRAGFDMTAGTFEDTLDLRLAYGTHVLADAFIDTLDPDTFDFVVIPGGKYVKNTVDDDTKIKGLLKRFNEQGKMIAAICAGPRFLGQLGLLDGKTFTAFRGNEIDMPKGTYRPERKALRDGTIITGRGAGAVYEFAAEITRYFNGEEAARELLQNIMH